MSDMGISLIWPLNGPLKGSLKGCLRGYPTTPPVEWPEYAPSHGNEGYDHIWPITTYMTYTTKRGNLVGTLKGTLLGTPMVRA